MNEPHWDSLIQGHLDDVLTEAERAEFDALMLQSAAARRRFWEIAEIHGLARDATRMTWGAALAATEEDDGLEKSFRSRTMSNWWTWLFPRPLAPLAAGLAIGILCTSMAWAYSVARSGKVFTLIQENFEAGPAPRVTGMPAQAGVWSGDYSAVVGEQQGVRPESGTKMLRILRADYEGKPMPEGSYVGDLYRLIDLRPYRSEFANGSAVAQVSAGFNAIPFSQEERYSCSVSVYALTAEMVANGSFEEGAALKDGALAMVRKVLPRLDRDPRTWERVEGDLRLPAEADFLLVHLGVSHATVAQQRPTFDGHYIDDVRVVLARQTPVP